MSNSNTNEPKLFNLESFTGKDLMGTHLLEASAGTGKTYTLERLVLKLLVEKKYRISQILIVTFTEKATLELRQRIRDLIVEEFRNSPRDSEEYILLSRAVSEWDAVAIYTIHGFCERALRVYPFESGNLFQQEISSGEDIIKETALDYFRKNQESLDLKGYACFRKKYLDYYDGIDALSRFYKKHVSKLYPDAGESCQKVLPELSQIEKARNLAALFERGDGALAKIVKELGSIENVEEILWHVKLGSPKKSVPAVVEAITGCAQAKTLEELLAHLVQKSISMRSKQNALVLKTFIEAPTDDDEALELAGIIESLFEALSFVLNGDSGTFKEHYSGMILMGFFYKAAAQMKTMIEQKKQMRETMDFDDIILRVYRSVMDLPDNSYYSQQLVSSLQNEYKAVLVDEFQDTDQYQWGIFKTLFDCPGHSLFLIGDPKQSIYGFRGADLEVYYDAKESVPLENRWQLGTNYRSLPGLVSGCNYLFSEVFRLGIPGERSLDFFPVQADGKKAGWIEDNQTGSINFLKITTENSVTNKDPALDLCMRITAYKIYTLLSGSKINKSDGSSRPLAPEDICILAETNKECVLMKDILSSRGISGVISQQKELYQSEEMTYILALLNALMSPSRSTLIKNVLVTPIFGVSFVQLEEICETETFDRIKEKFLEWREEAESGRLVGVLEDIFNHGIEGLFKGFYERVLREPQGERSSTNMNHFVEIIGNLSRSKSLDLKGLYRILSSLRDNKEEWDEQLMRLEREQGAVQIMTMHTSKGLEFPVVFFVGGFSPLSPGKDEYTFVQKGQKTTDLLCSGQNKTPSLQFQWEERKRLYYVALTRAVSCLYLPFVCTYNKGKIFDLYTSAFSNKGPLGAQLEGTSVRETGLPVSQGLAGDGRTKRFEALEEALIHTIQLESDENAFLNIEEFSSNEADEDVQLNTPVIQREKLEYQHLSTPQGFSQRHPEVLSYTSLASESYNSQEMSFLLSLPDEKDINDDDSFERKQRLEVDGDKGDHPDSIIDLPRGSVFGEMIHALFEKMDYSLPLKLGEKDYMEDPLVNEWVEGIIHSFFPFSWAKKQTKLVLQMLHSCMTSPLEGFAGESFCLGDVARENRKHELEFLLKTEETFVLPQWNIKQKGGYLKGFIDLVFLYKEKIYIVDWKTNFLGLCSEDYSRENIKKSMMEHHYYLQAHLYKTALSSYLKVVEPDRLFGEVYGGCLYLFARGCKGPAKGQLYILPEGSINE